MISLKDLAVVYALLGAAVVMFLLMGGCGNPRPWTTPEKLLAATTFACAAGDIATTFIGRNQGLKENNPMFKNAAAFVPLKLAILPLVYGLGEVTDHRAEAWGGAAAAGCAVFGWNVSEIAGH